MHSKWLKDCAQICSKLLRGFAQICSNLLKNAQSCSKLLRDFAQICSNLLNAAQICSDLLNNAQTYAHNCSKMFSCSKLLNIAYLCIETLTKSIDVQPHACLKVGNHMHRQVRWWSHVESQCGEGRQRANSKDLWHTKGMTAWDVKDANHVYIYILDCLFVFV